MSSLASFGPKRTIQYIQVANDVIWYKCIRYFLIQPNTFMGRKSYHKNVSLCPISQPLEHKKTTSTKFSIFLCQGYFIFLGTSVGDLSGSWVLNVLHIKWWQSRQRFIHWSSVISGWASSPGSLEGKNKKKTTYRFQIGILSFWAIFAKVNNRIRKKIHESRLIRNSNIFKKNNDREPNSSEALNNISLL